MDWILYDIRELLFFLSVILTLQLWYVIFEMYSEMFKGEMICIIWHSL